MFYTERIIPVPFLGELPIPGTRKILAPYTHYQGLYRSNGSYPIRTTIVMSGHNEVHHLNNPSVRYGPHEIRRLRISPEPKGIMDKWFPIRFRSV